MIDKMENVLYALDLYEIIIFNSSKKRFEFILEPDLKSGGMCGKKLTVPMFKNMILAKLNSDETKV